MSQRLGRLGILFLFVMMLAPASFVLAENKSSCTSDVVAIGDTAKVLPGDPNNIRAAPGKKAKYLTNMPQGSQFTITDGPACADGLIWWEVNYNGKIGWTAEGDGSHIWIQPISSDQKESPNCKVDLPFAIGDTGIMLPGPKNNVRLEPTTTAGLVFQMVQGTTFTVLDGPKCADHYRWWKISVNGKEGWTAEGHSPGEWLGPAN